jgi:2'-5' RNA ligase
VRDAVAEATAPLRDVAPNLAWVPAPRLHLTVKFLGERAPDAVGPLADALRAVGARHAPFAIALKGVGAFPNFRRARVVWLGIEPEPRLELLHHDVESWCERLGYELDGRAFRPHLTLARTRGPSGADVLRALARAARGVNFETEVDVTSIDLMRSTLGPRGSQYERLCAARLGAHVGEG